MLKIFKIEKTEDGLENTTIPPASEVLFNMNDMGTNLQIIPFLTFSFVTIVLLVILKQTSKCLKMVIEFLPESGCLMIGGILFSLLMQLFYLGFDRDVTWLKIDDWIIEHLMIAPVILHASYELFHLHFFGQLGTILMLAIVATLFNAVIIAAVLLLVNDLFSNYSSMNIFQCLTFGALISAVDPVAVLAVMSVVNADKGLYYLVFGESLLNDGITYVMFEGFKAFSSIPETSRSEISLSSYVILAVSFLTKPLGGVLTGFLFGLISAFISKFSGESTAFMKPLISILLAACGYTTALILRFSGILCLITYGLTQQRYTFRNLSYKASENVRNVVRGMAVILENLLFFFLGAELIVIEWKESWSFSLLVLVTITFVRIVVTFGLAYLINRYRKYPVDWKWQIIIIVGGLRGAIAFSMVVHYEGPFKLLFFDVTVIVIFVTTIFHGIAAKPLVKSLKLREEDNEEEEFDFDEHYGLDKEPSGCLQLWKAFEDKFLFKCFTKKRKIQFLERQDREENSDIDSLFELK